MTTPDDVVRVHVSAVKYDDGKPRWDLLPLDAVEEVAHVLRYGAKKYAERNWELGMSWGRMLRAAFGHLARWAMGEEYDESGMRHLAHASCCCLMLLAYTLRRVGADDRQKVVPDDRQKVVPDEP